MKSVDELQRQLARQTDRRAFLRMAAKVTAWISGSTLGVVFLSNKAAAWTAACCTFPSHHVYCGSCPGCPTGETNIYNWNCCFNNCSWTCLDCFDNDCSCAINNGTNCGGTCQGSGPNP